MSSTTPASAADQIMDWRQNIQQAYRSEEVNNIAKILASLEPSATPASKLMLASQFENMIFTSASSLSDYQKKITKRLKRMKKNYVATASTSATSEELAEREKEELGQLQRNLKTQYGEKLQLIVKNGALTVKEWTNKYGQEKAKTLKDHIDNAITWAAEIGAVPPEKAILVGSGKPVQLPRRTLERMNKVAKNLETRVENIRGYVVKLTKPDLFFGEKLEEMEEDLLLDHRSKACEAFVSSMKEALQKEGVDILAYAGIGTDATVDDGGVEAIKQQMEKIRSTIPIPRSAEEEKEVMITHLDRIRAAYQICTMYTILEPKVGASAKLQLAGSLRKVHDGVYESINFLRDSYRENRKKEGESGHDVNLEDAWNKILEYDEERVDVGVIESGDISGEGDTSNSESSQGHNAINRPKPIVIRSRILFNGNHGAPANLLDALKRKRAQICSNDSSTYLKLQFGEAFEMSVFFCPLLVSIRAVPEKEIEKKFEQSTFRKNVVDCKLGTWKCPSFGLRAEPLSSGSNFSALSSGRKRSANGQFKDHTLHTMSIMGVSGEISTLSPIIAKKLEYASAKATRCLRRCFADLVGRAYTSNSDYEIEISEGMAVLKFLQLARKKYQPDWEDITD